MTEESRKDIFQKSLLDLMISYIISIEEKNDKHKFGQNLIDILNSNIKDLEFKLERRKAKESLEKELSNPNQNVNNISTQTKEEFNEMMN